MALDPAVLRVMAITDGAVDTVVERTLAAVRGGVTSVQIRLKHQQARVIVEVTRALVQQLAAQQMSVPVLVNDRFDIAIAAGAAGVHLGADDLPIRAIRAIVPAEFIIGTSVGIDAEIANSVEADYVGIGPVYATQSKDDAGTAIGVTEFARLAKATGKPAIGVGGITPANAADVRRHGGAGVAVIGAIYGASDVMAAAQALYRATET